MSVCSQPPRVLHVVCVCLCLSWTMTCTLSTWIPLLHLSATVLARYPAQSSSNQANPCLFHPAHPSALHYNLFPFLPQPHSELLNTDLTPAALSLSLALRRPSPATREQPSIHPTLGETLFTAGTPPHRHRPHYPSHTPAAQHTTYS